MVLIGMCTTEVTKEGQAPTTDSVRQEWLSRRKLSVDGACPSSVTSVVQMPTKTIRELSKPAFGVLPKTGDAEPEDPGKPG